jgi:NADH-quinone oxidoreductase subunit H
MVTVSAMATTLFLGGWRAPWPLSLWADANQGWWPMLWFIGKMLVFLFVFIWLRGTLPRLRYDQFMRLGWKVLVPGSLLWILTVFAVRTWRTSGGDVTTLLITLGIGLAVALVVAFLVPERQVQEEGVVEVASDYPVPPLDLKVPAPSKHKLRRRPVEEPEPAPALAGGDNGKETE